MKLAKRAAWIPLAVLVGSGCGGVAQSSAGPPMVTLPVRASPGRAALDVGASTDAPKKVGRSPARPSVVWRSIEDEEAVRKAAFAEGRPVVVYFSAAWCASCGEIDKRTLTAPAVLSERERFETVRIDATDDEDEKRLSAKYKVIGLPSIVVFDATGTEVKRIHEFTEAPIFAKVPAAVR